MPGIAVQGLDRAGGAQIAGGQPILRLDGALAVVLGDPVTPHGSPPHAPRPVMAEATACFTIAGISTCRAGHRASCGHATSGRSWFTIP